MKKYTVTSALPYANGKLHIGHVAGAYLPADIFVRYLRLNNQDVIFICGTDEHGAPISIKADTEKVDPGFIVEKYHRSIKESFDGLGIDFDNFSGTSRPEHHKLAQQFFLNLLKNNYISTKTNEQFYCDHCVRFLADRYVEGECPFCSYGNARGDQCDKCGKLMDTTTLKKPRCKICGESPIVKETSHWFINLPAFEPKLKKWLKTKKNWKENILQFILGLLEEGLIERAITRDLTWGVKVPLGGAEGKVLYVWFEAPVGYISSTIEWSKKIGKPEKWKEYWKNPDAEVYHFIGKDNNIFHAIFWPSILIGQHDNYNLPYDIPANEFLNLEGQKISTSRNWAIWVDEFLNYFDGELLRYYLAAIAPETKDSDFSWKEFQLKINNDLANVLGNFANRVFTFSQKYFGGKIERSKQLSIGSQKIYNQATDLCNEIKKSYSEFKVRKATKLCIDIARLGNKYFDDKKPWLQVKQSKSEAEETIYLSLELLKMISAVFKPVMPKKMKELATALNLGKDIVWSDLDIVIEKYDIGNVTKKNLFRKIADEEINKQLDLLEKQSV